MAQGQQDIQYERKLHIAIVAQYEIKQIIYYTENITLTKKSIISIIIGLKVCFKTSFKVSNCQAVSKCKGNFISNVRSLVSNGKLIP